MTFNRTLVTLFVVTVPVFCHAMETSSSALHFYGIHRRSQSQPQKNSVNKETQKIHSDQYKKFETALDFLHNDKKMSLDTTMHCYVFFKNSTAQWLKENPEASTEVRTKFSKLLEKTDKPLKKLNYLMGNDLTDIDLEDLD